MINKVVIAAMAVTLSACVTNPPQPDTATRAGSPTATTQASKPVGADKPSSSSNTPATAAPQKSAAAPASVAPAKSVASGGAVANGQPDWAVLFKSWENGCASSPDLKNFESKFASLDDNGEPKIGAVSLPAGYKGAVGKIALDPRSSSIVTLPILAGTYYGIPVKSYYVYFDNHDGGRSLTLNAAMKDVKAALGKQKVVYKKGKVGLLRMFGEGKETTLLCPPAKD